MAAGVGADARKPRKKPGDLLLLVAGPLTVVFACTREVQVATSMEDLVAALDGALLVSLSFEQHRRRRKKGGRGYGGRGGRRIWARRQGVRQASTVGGQGNRRWEGEGES